MSYEIDAKNRLLQKMIPYCNKFNPCRIERNQLQYAPNSDVNQYIFEEPMQTENRVGQQSKQNLTPHHQRKQQSLFNHFGNSKAPELGTKLADSALHSRILLANKSEEHAQYRETAQLNSEVDVTDLWNRIQNQQQNISGHSYLAPSPHSNDSGQTHSKQIKQDSSCELTEQELQKWMQGFQISTESEKICASQQRHNSRINCIYQADIAEKIVQEGEDRRDWGSWQDIAKELENIKIQNDIELYNNQKLTSLDNKIEGNLQNDNFVIIDLACTKISEEPVHIQGMETLQSGNHRFQNILELSRKYGPWNFSQEAYKIYQKNQVILIHELPIESESCHISKQKKNSFCRQGYEILKPLRKINWQIYEEKKPQIRALKSKRNCRMVLMEHGKDFFIFDQVKFSISAIRQGTHAYFGIKAFGDFVSTNQKQRQSSGKLLNPEIKQLKEYLYMPTSGECLLETNYEGLGPELKENKIKKFSINLCMTKEKVAVCERLVTDENKQKREIIEVKFFDGFENSEAQYLGIIESKISNFSQQWYCDTIIYIPKMKVYSNKIQEKNWEKFKIQLRLSETGSIVAELGIFEAESSVTNCILFGETKTSQFMMGTLHESSNQIDYILRIAGLSPVMGFAATISRKIFVISS